MGAFNAEHVALALRGETLPATLFDAPAGFTKRDLMATQ